MAKQRKKTEPLGDNDIMPFGVFNKTHTAMANVDASYLKWVRENVKRNPTTGPVLDYIEDNWDAIEKELKKPKKQ